MNLYWIIFICLVLKIQSTIQNSEVDKFLEEQSRIAKEKITQKINRTNDLKNIEKENLLLQHKCEADAPTANIFTIFNNTFIKINEEVFKINFNHSLKLENYTDFPKIDEECVFFKATDYKDSGIIVVGLNSGEVQIYRTSNKDPNFEKIQAIDTKNVKDGKLLKNNGNLYLILVKSNMDSTVYTSIYKWMETYFDEYHVTFTNAAIKIASFAYETSEVIIILQDISGKKAVLSVYEFKNDKLKKIQLLETENPYHIDTFVQNGKNYVIIYEKSNKNMVYLWNGYSLQEISTFRWDNNIAKSTIIVYSNSTPLIVKPELEKVEVYRLFDKNIRLEYTREYMGNYSVILDVNKGRNENGNITFIAGLSEDHIININATSFRVLHPQMEPEEDGAIRKCFINLEHKIYEQRKRLNQTKKPSLPLPSNYNHDPTKHTAKRHAPDSIVFPSDETSIESKLDTMQNRLDKVKSFIIKQKDSQNDLVFNETVTIKNSITATTVKAQQMTVKTVNDKEWIPQNWLRYRKPQTIPAPVKINTLNTNLLVVNPEQDTFFKSLATSRGNITFRGKLSVKNLKANNILLDKINDIAVQDIALKSTPIKGKKLFNNIQSSTSTIDIINQKKSQEILTILTNPSKPKTFEFSTNVTIKNLWVEKIDNVNWEDFKKSVFLVGEDTTIEGNLVLPELKTGRLKLNMINNFRPEDLLTKTTDQTVESAIEFNIVEASSITVNTVNDVPIENIAVLGHDNEILTPVVFHKINVSNDLELKGDIDKSFFYHSSGRLLGSNESDFKQIYTGKITIDGDLFVTNLNVDPNIKMIVNGSEITPHFFDDYWSKSKNQTIPVHFEATEGLSAPHLETLRLNGISIDNFAVNHKNTTLSGPLFFENVIVDGNVTLNRKAKNVPDLNVLERNAVKRNGTFIIKGRKVFKNSLKVNSLTTNLLNGTNMYDVVTTSRERPIAFKTIHIIGNLTSNLTTDILNGINLLELKENAIYTDKPQNLLKLYFKNLTVGNLSVSTFDGYNMSKYINSLQNILSNKEHFDLKINGNISIGNIQNVTKINDYDVNDIMEEVNDGEPDFKGDVIFLKKVKINNLIAPVINNIDFPNLTQRLLYKTSNQTVTAQYTFENLMTGNLFAPRINKKDVTNLIDVTVNQAQEIFTLKNNIFQNSTFKTIKAYKMLPCDIHSAVTNLKYPKTQKWKKIQINGNITVIDEDCDLYKILHKSVRLDKENVITAPIHITENLLAENIKTHDNCINGINLTEIANDAVLNFVEDKQIITGHKTFLEMYATNVYVNENTDVPLIITSDSDILVPAFYKMIVTKDKLNKTISGKKTFFAGLQTDRVWVTDIMGIKPENIVSLSNLSEIPSVIFDSLEVSNNLQIEFVNNKNLNNIFENRLLLNASDTQTTDAVYFFENLEVKNLFTPSINDIFMEDVVFDIDAQNITAPKTFSNEIQIIGNVSADFINNVNISEAFKNAILLDKNNIVNGSMMLLKPSTLLGNITAYEINGFPIEKINKIFGKTYDVSEEAVIYDMQRRIKAIIHKRLAESYYLPNELVYIEKSSDIQISIPNANDARITKTKGYVLIHVSSYESPEKCNLPEGCKCPMQQTIEITPEKSVSYFLSKDQKRIYSYDDDTMTIHFITNSVSSSNECRTNLSRTMNEFSTLTWSTTTTVNQNGTFNNYHPSFFKGYISGAEFFTFKGQTYGVIAKYYDPVLDTHYLDCTVIKFSDDKKSVQEIQTIPTQGVQTIHIVHTLQGVVLVIGNRKGYAFTEIYRFHETEDKFILLKSVPYSCTKAVGVVLDADSLIILANEDHNSPLQVLKYNPLYDNYYYYQMLTLDETVVGISVFYIGGFGIGDAYLCIVTRDTYRIYSFQYIDGWKLETLGNIKGLRNLVQFEMENQLYLFAPSSEESLLLTVVKHGPGQN